MIPKGNDPRAIANLILDCGQEEGLEFSNLALQKLLYFAHASYLLKYREPLIYGVFEAWEHGPVCRLIYDDLRHYGRKRITSRITRTDIFSINEKEIPLPKSKRVVSHVYAIVSTLGKLSPTQLVNLSHKKGGPWDSVWNNKATSASLGNRISDELIREKFSPLVLPMSDDPKERIFYEATPFAGN